MDLKEFKEIIFEYINKKKKTDKSSYKMKEKISNLLLEHNKVFKSKDDKDELIPYIILDDNSITEFDTNNIEIQSLFSCTFGIDLFQNKFAKELFNYIKGKICLESKLKVLHKYTHIENNIFYSSCGRNHIITTDNSTLNLCKYKMGYNDIYFNPNYTLPEWNISKSNSLFDENINIFDNIKAFNITPYIPDGLNIFTIDMQIYVLKRWILSAFMKIKPFPILLFYGNKSSGKTLTSKAIMKLFLGDNKNVSISPDNKRSLMSCITEHFIYTIDNLDSKVQPWFNDTLTLASTGGELSERALFTNSKIYKKDIISSVIITSRNPSFAKREDIKDRILPIFLDDRIDYSYSEEALLKEVLLNRDKILTELFEESQLFLNYLKKSNIKFEHKYRFTTFGKLLEFNFPKGSNINFTTKELINAITSAQFNSLTDIDPVIQHILEFDYTELKCIEHTPKEIIELLKLENIKPRVLSRKLKENSDIFIFNGWSIKSEKFGHSTKYFIYPPTYTSITI